MNFHQTITPHRLLAVALSTIAIAAVLVFSYSPAAQAQDDAKPQATQDKIIRIGVIGLDTSHVFRFTEIINNPKSAEYKVARVVAAYPQGSTEIESSASRIPKYTKDIQKWNVKIVDSIAELLEQVDVVMLETNDGNPRLEQALQVIDAGKPMFIDKPIAATLVDTIAIYEAAKRKKVPVYSISSYFYSEGGHRARNGEIGKVVGAFSYGKCELEPSHSPLFWYGIHGVQQLYSALGTGCKSVTRTHHENADVVVGIWDNGAVGTFKGIRGARYDFGGKAYGSKQVIDLGPYGRYPATVADMVKFFQTHEAPITEEETMEIYTFMTAAEMSSDQGGKPVELKPVYENARKEALEKLENIAKLTKE